MNLNGNRTLSEMLHPGSIKEQLSRLQRRELRSSALTHSAVLLPLVQKDTGIYLLLTKRTETVEHHKGQISFPGGAVSCSDTSTVGTALREAEEEIGLPSSSVDILGVMHDIKTPTGFIITPVVGFIKDLPPLIPNNREVAEIISLPLEYFTDNTKRTSQWIVREGIKIEVFFYHVWREPVWGATAFCIKEFIDIVVQPS
jgi:8-oxo-dGTP pyrophosphatase MutT (NUDIX family)